MKYPLRVQRQIRAMCQADQEMRRENIDDPVFWIEGLDQKHTTRMKQIVATYGWPTTDLVSAEISNDAWLLVQHADHDVEFQKMCLSLMKAAGDHVSRQNVACLEDRVLINSGRSQMYGTQFYLEGQQLIPRPIEDEAHVNERRAEMGLDTLEQGIKDIRQKYAKK